MDAPNALCRYRQEAGLTQAELAGRIGVDTATLCRWETGKRIPAPRFWSRIRDVTGGRVTADDFAPADSVTEDAA